MPPKRDVIPRGAALHCHPDKNSSARAGEAFKWVSEAYAALSNPVRRAMFNKQRALLAAPCIDCILRKNTEFEEKLRQSVNASRVSNEGGRSGSAFRRGVPVGGGATVGEFGGSVRMSDPAFQQRRGYGARVATESEESWQEKRERWLRQLDKSKAKAQVGTRGSNQNINQIFTSLVHVRSVVTLVWPPKILFRYYLSSRNSRIGGFVNTKYSLPASILPVIARHLRGTDPCLGAFRL